MAGATAGEPGLFICFSESEEQLYLKAESFDLDLRGAVARGVVSLLCLAPVELEVDIFAAMLRERVERLGIRRLVVDSNAAVEVAILEPNRAAGFFASLINYLREHDVTSVMTQESNAFDGGVGESLGAVFADNLIRLGRSNTTIGSTASSRFSRCARADSIRGCGSSASRRAPSASCRWRRAGSAS